MYLLCGSWKSSKIGSQDAVGLNPETPRDARMSFIPSFDDMITRRSMHYKTECTTREFEAVWSPRGFCIDSILEALSEDWNNTDSRLPRSQPLFKVLIQ